MTANYNISAAKVPILLNN